MDTTDDMQWRFLDTGTGSAIFNLALDEARIRMMTEGESTPSVRFYRWDEPVISIGYHQHVDSILDAAACHRDGISVVRRITAGGAVLHGADVSYSVACPAAAFGRRLRIKNVFREIHGLILAGLVDCGIAALMTAPGTREHIPPGNACFISQTVFDIMSDGKKIAGSAQRRFGRHLLLQGTMYPAGGQEDIRRYLARGDGKCGLSVREKGSAAGVLPETMVNSVKERFRQRFPAATVEKQASDDESALADTLTEERYAAKGWLMRYE